MSREDFPDPSKIPTPSLDGEETVVGVHESGIQLVEGANSSLKRNYCSKCAKMTHSFVKIDKETKEAKIHITCSNNNCECPCRKAYQCKICGHLHPHGQTVCNYREIEPPRDLKAEEEFNKMLEQWRKRDKAEENVITEKPQQ